jgi:hypothetical protein
LIVTAAAALLRGLRAQGRDERQDRARAGGGVQRPAAQLGIQMRNGIQSYFALVNEKGGVQRPQARARHRGRQVRGQGGAGASKKLIEEHKVFALLGYVGTPTGAEHSGAPTRPRCRWSACSPAPRALRVAG